jgi:hypothetical protein
MGGWAMGIQDIPATEKISVYPNPAGNESYILVGDKSVAKEDLHFMVADVLGNIHEGVAFTESGNGKFKVDLKSLAPGLYFIIVSGTDFHRNLKLIKI